MGKASLFERTRPPVIDTSNANDLRSWLADASAILDALILDANEATSRPRERRYSRVYLRRRMNRAGRELRALLFEVQGEAQPQAAPEDTDPK